MKHRYLHSTLILAATMIIVGWVSYQHSLESQRTESVFVYATLTNPFIRTLACGCLVTSTPTLLPDFEKIGRTVHPAPDQTVPGQRIMVTPTELARLDQYERVPNRYRREQISIDDTAVWIYIKNE